VTVDTVQPALGPARAAAWHHREQGV